MPSEGVAATIRVRMRGGGIAEEEEVVGEEVEALPGVLCPAGICGGR
jgi:hypothetical protein